jgi:hypothetical protein
MAILVIRTIITARKTMPTKIFAAYSHAKYSSKNEVFAEATAKSPNKINARNTTIPTKNGLANNFSMITGHPKL